MATSINNYLRDLSYRFYLKNDSEEIKKIDASLSALFSTLNTNLGGSIKRKFVFGSYDRDTILPRIIDRNSDIDIMIVFHTTELEKTPETYRTWLKSFADKYYQDRYGSVVVKSFPTVTIRLGHIHYDLVPAKEVSFFGTSTLYIPDKGNNWQITNPHDVKAKLTDANTRYNLIIRPIIRLLKAWNCTNNYPFDSYDLELRITSMNFFGDNIQSGFFKAVRQLTPFFMDPQIKKDKIQSLKNNIDKVIEALENDNAERAKQWLHRAIPN